MVRLQQELEARYLRLSREKAAEDATMEALFGPMEDWLLPLGVHQLLLMPANGEWALLDPHHQSWEHTGVGPGEVDFLVEAGKLVIKRRPGAPPLRADLGEDRWYVRNTVGTTGPYPRAAVVEEAKAGNWGEQVAVRRVGTPVWLRVDALYRPAGSVERGVATLQVMSGAEVGRQILLEERTLLGSGAESTVWLDDSSLSAVHTEILHVGGDRWQIRHLGGPGGSWRNGRMIQGWESLVAGDKVELGRYHLVFHQLKEVT